MNLYLKIVACAFAFFVKSEIGKSQLNETNRLLYKASSLHGFNTVRNKAAQDIYNQLIAKEPSNAVIYAESSFFNLTYADKELGMADLNVAMYLLENRVCACDYEHLYNIKNEDFFCSLELLEKIYTEKERFFYEKKEFDSTAVYINKLIRLYSDSSGTNPDYSKFENNNTAINKLNSKYQDMAQNSGSLKHYREALHNYQRIIANDSYKKSNIPLTDLYAVVGEYDSVLQIMKRELFTKTDSGIRFIGEYPSSAPRYFFDYISAYISKRDFENAHKLLISNTTYGKIPDSKGEKGKLLLKDFPMYMIGEHENICDRIDQEKIEYSFFYYYSCVLNDLTNKNYENALLHLNNFYKIMAPRLLKLADSPVQYFIGESFQFDYTIFSLKGYLLSKLNQHAEAKLAYQQALKLNPECREALEELKAIN